MQLHLKHQKEIVNLLKTFLVVSAMCISSLAFGQTQYCSPSQPAVIYQNNSGISVDMGTCVLFQGPSSTFNYYADYDPQFGDLFLYSPITITLDYSSPDTYSSIFTVWVCDSICGTELTPPVIFTPNGTGQWSTQVPITFQPGMRLRIIEQVEVTDSNSQCFSFGYYCYFSAKFSLQP